MKQESQAPASFMERLASLIVDRRNAFLAIFFVLILYAALSVSKVHVNDEITDYLAEDSETRQGLAVMEEEFTTFGSAQILIANIPYDRALELARELEEIRGISAVQFYDAQDDAYEKENLEDYYKDAAALFTVTFEEPEETPLSQQAIAQLRSRLEGYDAYFYTTVDKDDSAALQQEMGVIMCLAVLVIVVVLLFTSQTFIEVAIFLITFATAAVLNLGTNYWFPQVSFITNSVCSVLQLAMAIDYAIILFHRYMEEKALSPSREALVTALSKAIPEIASSSLTTVSGMLALVFMQFGIGPDLGWAMVKAILISLLTVFFFMPGLICLFDPLIEKTAHRSFVPSISLWGRAILKLRWVLAPLAAILIGAGCYFSYQCPYLYDLNSVETKKMDEYRASKMRIEQTFSVDNTMALILPAGDYQKEAQVIRQLEQLPGVDSAMGLASIEIDEEQGYTLVDSLRPLEFSDVAGLDVGTAELLYLYYAVDQEEYGALLSGVDEYRVPIIRMVDFIYDQKENKGLKLDEDLSTDIDDIHAAIRDAREQLEGEQHSRIVLSLDVPTEGEETFRLIDEIHSIALDCYPGYESDIFLVGDSTSAYELSQAFQRDNAVISVLTVLFVGVILFFTFQSASLPFLLCLVIQGSVWINFSLPVFHGSAMYFLSYLVVSSIQMGATIDYAIVITSRYIALRKEGAARDKAVTEALNQAFPTVVTSGTILCSAGFLVGKISSNSAISSLGSALGSGTLISIILVMTVLPAFLVLGDSFIRRTSFALPHPKGEPAHQVRKSQDAVRVDGQVSGWFSGWIDAQVSGKLRGEMDFTLKSGRQDAPSAKREEEIIHEDENVCR